MAEYVVIDKEQLESDLTVVADAIREKGGTSEQLAFPSGMADAVRGIESGGGVDYLKYVSTAQFKTNDLPPITTLNLDNVAHLQNLIQGGANLEEITINCNNQITAMYRTFYNYVDRFMKLKKITLNVDTSQCTNFSQAFNYLYCTDENGKGIVEIIGALDLSSATATSNMFAGNPGLKEVRFVTETIPLTMVFTTCKDLSATSIQSIIDGLAYVETTQTLTFNVDIEAKLTEEQKAQITSKNWTLAFGK